MTEWNTLRARFPDDEFEQMDKQGLPIFTIRGDPKLYSYTIWKRKK